MKSQIGVLAVLLACTAGLATSCVSSQQASKPKYTTHEIMEAIHSGEQNVGKKVLQGNGTDEDFAKIVHYYESLPLNTPEMGDQASWEAKTTKLLAAAKGLKPGDAAALAKFKDAANCKACHEVHKPE